MIDAQVDLSNVDGVNFNELPPVGCLLYTSDAADDLIGGDLCGAPLVQKKKNKDNR